MKKTNQYNKSVNCMYLQAPPFKGESGYLEKILSEVKPKAGYCKDKALEKALKSGKPQAEPKAKTYRTISDDGLIESLLN